MKMNVRFGESRLLKLCFFFLHFYTNKKDLSYAYKSISESDETKNDSGNEEGKDLFYLQIFCATSCKNKWLAYVN